VIAKIKPMNMKIFKRVFYYNPSRNTNFRLLQRHNMIKMQNKIPSKVSDFSVYLHWTHMVYYVYFSLPSFPQLSSQNSSMLCACFVLNLQTPIPVSLSILQRIQQVTGKFPDWFWLPVKDIDTRGFFQLLLTSAMLLKVCECRDTTAKSAQRP
jgi:hypothetical protein